MAFLIKFNFKELRKRPSLGLPYLRPAALLFYGCFKGPSLEGLVPSLPKPYRLPSDQLICLMASPQRQQKSKSELSDFSLLASCRNSPGLPVLDAQNSLDILFLQILTWQQSAADLKFSSDQTFKTHWVL